MDFNKYYEDRQKLVNTFLEKRLEKKGISRVDEAMAYSLLAGGKRIRPIILMASSTTSMMRSASKVIVTVTSPMPEALAEYVPGL